MLSWIDYKLKTRRLLRDYSKAQNWRAFYTTIDKSVKDIVGVYEFTILNFSTPEGFEGLSCFSPTGEEIYKEVPRMVGWRYRVLKEALNWKA